MIAYYATVCVTRPRMILLLILIPVLLLVSGGLRLQFDADTRTFVGHDGAHAQALQQFEHYFGSANLVIFIVTARSGHIIEEDSLIAIQELTDKARLMPFSTQVQSLSTIQQLLIEDHQISVAPLFTKAAIATAQMLDTVYQRVFDHTDLVDRLISADGSVALVVVHLQPPHQDRHEGSAIADFSRTLQDEIQHHYPGVEVRLSGDAIADSTFGEATRRDLLILAPLMATLAFLALIIGLGSLSAAVITLLVMAGSAAMTLGLAGWLGLTINAATAAAPVIIMTLAAADCIHLIVLAQTKYQAGFSRRAALIESIRFNMLAIFMTSVTDVLGFFTLNLGASPPLRDLGNLVSVGVIAAFILSVTLAPALMMLLPKALNGHRLASRPRGYRFTQWLIARRRGCALVFLLLSTVAVFGVTRIVYEDDFVRYFDDSYAFRRDTEYLEQQLTALQILEFALPAAETGAITAPAYLAQIDAFAHWLRNQPEVRHVIALSDVIKRLNKTVHGDDPSFEVIPEDNETVAQLLLFYELSAPLAMDLSTQIDATRSHSRLTLMMRRLSSAQTRAFADRAETWLKTHSPDIAAPATGLYLTYAHVAQENVQAMMGGALLSLSLIVITLVVALRNVRLALLSLIPNILPALVTLGLWGWFFGEVNLAVSVVAAISFGIIVDDTTHIFARFAYLRRAGLTPKIALQETMQEVGFAIFLTTGVLVTGFLIQAGSSFAVSAQMGLLTAMTITIALIAEFCLAPSLLLLSEKSPP